MENVLRQAADVTNVTQKDLDEIYLTYETMEADYEIYRMANQHCDNCRSFYEEYGIPMCKKHEDVLENWKEERCLDWR